MTRRAREFVSGGLVRSLAPVPIVALALVCLAATTPRQRPDEDLSREGDPFRIRVAADPAFGRGALVRDGDRVRFDLDRRTAPDAGLTVSSKLLRVARRVFNDDRIR